MPAPRHWVAQLVEGSTVVCEDLSTSPDLEVSWALNDGGSGSFSLPPGSPLKTLVRPLITDLRVNYKGTPWWRGRVISRRRGIDDTTATASYVAVDYRTILSRRLVLGDWSSGTAVNPPTTAWDRIDGMQNRPGLGWDLGLSKGAWLGFGPDRILTAEGGETLEAMVSRWADQHPGFDWWIDAARRFQAAPWRGEQSVGDWVLRWGETVDQLDEDFDSAGYANDMIGTGADGIPRYRVSAFDNPLDPPRPEGRWQHLAADTNLKTAGQVEANADQHLTRMSTLAPGYSASVIRGAWSPEKAWIGDLVPIQSRHPELTVDTVDRITGIKVKVDPHGLHPEVSIETGTRFREDLAVMLGRLPRRLAELDRR